LPVGQPIAGKVSDIHRQNVGHPDLVHDFAVPDTGTSMRDKHTDSDAILRMTNGRTTLSVVCFSSLDETLFYDVRTTRLSVALRERLEAKSRRAS
jgi:hypothetical protein